MPAERFISRLPIKRLIHDSKPSTISRLMVGSFKLLIVVFVSFFTHTEPRLWPLSVWAGWVVVVVVMVVGCVCDRCPCYCEAPWVPWRVKWPYTDITFSDYYYITILNISRVSKTGSFADNLKTSAKLPNSVGFGEPDRRRNLRPPGTDEADSNRSPSAYQPSANHSTNPIRGRT